MLFYIAYLREVKDPISNATHPCDDGNCLPVLQQQMFVVFTGKTIGKQIAFTLKPFVIRALNRLAAQSQARKVLSRGIALMPMMPGSPKAQDGSDEEHEVDNDGNITPMEIGADGRKHKITDPVEKQTHLMAYEDTFQDFCDRIIQFGYIVLFAPAFPLAPFLAFINNGPGPRGAVKWR